MKTILVDAAGKGDFPAITAALGSLEPGETGILIKLRPGVYREKVKVLLPGITIVGEDPATTVIQWDDHAKRQNARGIPMGTFNSYTLYAGAPDFLMENVTVENSAGPGWIKGQAIAVYADSDRISFRNCVISGFQDTLCTGPLPTDPSPKGVNPLHHLRGSGNDIPERPFRQYYRECTISGTVDFIFGSATAVFDKCRIISRRRDEELFNTKEMDTMSGKSKICPPERFGYITAPSTYPDEKHGFVFLDCILDGDAARDSVFLARPWRIHAKAAFVNCWMGPHIQPVGWSDWSKPGARSSVMFAEYGSRGPGAGGKSRLPWAVQLDASGVRRLAAETILRGKDGWNPL